MWKKNKSKQNPNPIIITGLIVLVVFVVITIMVKINEAQYDASEPAVEEVVIVDSDDKNGTPSLNQDEKLSWKNIENKTREYSSETSSWNQEEGYPLEDADDYSIGSETIIVNDDGSVTIRLKNKQI